MFSWICRQVGKATYVPANYAKAQNDWVENFFLQNGYLEYDALIRLGISDPKSTIKRKFTNDKITFLKSCCVGENVRNIAEIQIGKSNFKFRIFPLDSVVFA